MMRLTLTVGLALSALWHDGAVRAENWPGFRGPTGMGFSAERDLPTRWGGANGENILWKTTLPPTATDAKADLNQSSPIIWNDRVFVSTAFWPKGAPTNEPPKQHLTCYQLADGKEIWTCAVPPGPWKLGDLRGGYAASTPATDGERIYVAFGSATIAAIDMQGKIVWQHDIENHTSIDVAFASSPVLFEKRVILLCDKNNKHATLTAYDAASGATAWTRKRPDVAFNHSTPVLVRVNDKPQLLIAASNALQGVDPASGEIVWSCKTPGDVTSPIYHDGIVYCDSGRGGPGVAVDPTGAGDVTASHARWRIGNIPEGLASPAIADGLMFRTHNPGVLRCVRWSDGGVQFSARLPDASMQASPFASADGLVYFASGGKSYVIRPGKSLDVAATNDLGDPSAASAAVSQGRILIKGGRTLYCIGKKSP